MQRKNEMTLTNQVEKQQKEADTDDFLLAHILKIKSFEKYVLCLVLLQVPKCFGLVQIFCVRPKIYLHIVAVTNILCLTKR